MDHREAPPGVNLLSEAKEILGIRLLPGPSPAESWVTLQYADHKDGWHQVAIPFLEAMHLANLFRAMVRDTKFQLPKNPSEKPR